jgi:hypothetical protein
MSEPQFLVRKTFQTQSQRFKRGTKGIPLSSFAGQALTAEKWCELGYLSPMVERQSEITMPIDRALIKARLDALQAQFIPDKFTMPLFDAIALCCRENLRLPIWVKSGFLEGYAEIENRRTRSLDKSFGQLLPRQAKITGLRSPDQSDAQVVALVRDLLSIGRTIPVSVLRRAFPSSNIHPQAVALTFREKTVASAIKFASEITGVGQAKVKKLWDAAREEKKFAAQFESVRRPRKGKKVVANPA